MTLKLDAELRRTVCWRKGSREASNVDLTSRFAAVRLRAASRGDNCSEPRAEERLLIEWSENALEPTKY